MKLRNKKTGEIGHAIFINEDEEGSAHTIRMRFSGIYYIFNTLEEMNNVFEDYHPAEPLIKDKKIRKMVKNFALSTNATWIQYESTPLRGEFWMEGGFIGNNAWRELEGLVNHQCYTIAELCGEEEE